MHRDIKPENIIAMKAGSIRIADLGSASKIDFEFSGCYGATEGYFPFLDLPVKYKVDKYLDYYALSKTAAALVPDGDIEEGSILKKLIELSQNADNAKVSARKSRKSEEEEVRDIIIEEINSGWDAVMRAQSPSSVADVPVVNAPVVDAAVVPPTNASPFCVLLLATTNAPVAPVALGAPGEVVRSWTTTADNAHPFAGILGGVPNSAFSLSIPNQLLWQRPVEISDIVGLYDPNKVIQGGRLKRL